MATTPTSKGRTYDDGCAAHALELVGERGDADRPGAIIDADPDTLAALVYDSRQLAEAMRSRDIKVEGDESAVARFLDLFPLPEPAEPAVGA